MVKYLLKMNLVLLFISSLTVHLTAGNAECPNDEGLVNHNFGLIFLEGVKVSLEARHPCACYNLFFDKNPNSTHRVPEEIISGQNGFTIDYQSPNCSLTIFNTLMSHAGVYTFQRRNYKATKNGVLKHAFLQWNYDLLILGKSRCGLQFFNDTQIQEDLLGYVYCEGYYAADQTKAKVGTFLYINSNLTNGAVWDTPGYFGKIVVLRKYENFACKVGLEFPQDHQILVSELDICMISALYTTSGMDHKVSGCQWSAYLNLLVIGFGSLLAWANQNFA